MTSFSHRLYPVCTLALAALIGCATQGDQRPTDLAALREAMNVVHDRYVRDVPDDQLTRDALKGMMAGLDPHSAYMDVKEYREFTSDTRGEFGGIGAELARDGGRVKVIAPIDDTPAARAGIQPGDTIERVNGKPSTASTSARSSSGSAAPPGRPFGSLSCAAPHRPSR